MIAQVQIDNQIVNYTFNQPSFTDFKETDWIGAYTCGLFVKKKKKKYYVS